MPVPFTQTLQLGQSSSLNGRLPAAAPGREQVCRKQFYCPEGQPRKGLPEMSLSNSAPSSPPLPAGHGAQILIATHADTPSGHQDPHTDWAEMGRQAGGEGATWWGPAGLRQRLCIPPSSWCTERAGTELSAGQVQVESVKPHSDGEDRLRSFLGRGLYLWPAISERTGPRRQPGPLEAPGQTWG